MSTLLPIFIVLLQEYGYPVLGLMVFIAAVGAPLPISLILLAMGAFAALGDFDIKLLILLTVTASVCGDGTGYFIGRRWGSKVLKSLEQPRRRSVISAATLLRARTTFKRYGGWAIFLSRFLFSALGGVINLVAGAEFYPYRGFLLYDVMGQVLGATIPLLLGYVFAVSWETIGNVLGAFSGFAFGLVCVVGLVIFLVRSLRGSKGEPPMEVVMNPSGPLPLS